MSKKTVLFLCTRNSCRSQMAEGWMRHLYGDRFEVCSAGIEKHVVDPRAVTVMRESGVDISGHVSKTIAELSAKKFDYVITVCDSAREKCPWIQASIKNLHCGFPDPPLISRGLSDEDIILDCYRSVRDAIRNFIVDFVKERENT